MHSPLRKSKNRNRKREQGLLRESEEKFAKAFQCSPQPFTLSTLKEDRFLEVNAAFELKTGYRREEIIGHTVAELGIWESYAERGKLVERILRGEPIRNVECRFRKKTGEIFIGLLSAELVELAGEMCVVANAIDITDWRRTEESLRATEKKAALYLQQTMFGVIEWDVNFRVVEWNPAAESIFGYRRAEAVGRHPNELIVPPHLAAEIDEVFTTILNQTGGQLSVNENLRKTGETIVCEWFNTPLVAEDGEVIGVMSLVHDITRQKKTESELTRSQTMLSSLFDSTEDMIWTVDPERFGLMMFNAGLGRYFARNRGFELRVGMTPDELLPTAETRELWKNFYRRALNEGWFTTEYRVVAQTNILELSFHVLRHDGQVFGISVFGRDVTAARQAERALKESQDRYRSLVESSNDWVWEVDVEAKYTYVGPQSRSLLGYKPEEILGKKPFDFMPELEALRVAEVFGAIAKERKPFHALENVNLHKNGHPVVLETNGTPIFDEHGNFVGYRGMDRDITDRQRAEEALRQSQEQFQTLANAIPQLCWIANGDGWIFWYNQRWYEYTGTTPQQVEGWGWQSVHDPEALPKVLERWKETIATGNPFDMIFPLRRADGVFRLFLTRVMPVKNAEGRVVRWFGTNTDITEQKQTEEELRKINERLDLAAEVAELGEWDLDLIDHSASRSLRHDQIFGYQSLLPKWTYEMFLEHVLPEDRAEVNEKFGQSLSSGTWDFETRIRRADGEVRWIWARGRCRLGEKGPPSHMFGTVIDITEFKLAEERLREYEKAIEASEEMIAVVDHEYRYVIANRAFLKYLNMTKEQVIGHLVPDVMNSGSFDSIVKEKLDQGFEGRVVRYEMKHSYPDHGERDLFISYFPIEGATGINRVACILQDITERRKIEEALRESEERFRTIANSAPVMIWMTGPDKLCTYCNKPWLDFKGRPLEAELGNGWAEGIHPEDLGTCMETYSRSFDLREPFKLEYRLRRHDGEYRWIADTGVPRSNADGSFAGYIGSCVDDTDRRAAAEALRSVSGRLIQAQEQERKRIARELHDDINQRLAMVAVELQQLHMSPNLSAGQRNERIEKLFKDTTDITSGIQALSHQLHSTRLDYLGLVPAIQGFCDELARQRQVKIDFVHSDIPVSLSADVALALFRVTQEALHNAVKYSGVRVFEVRLLGTAGHIELTVRDSGVGFGLDGAMQGRGLGLISMRERILPLKGKISIVSKPMQGTEITVRVPVSSRGYVESVA